MGKKWRGRPKTKKNPKGPLNRKSKAGAQALTEFHLFPNLPLELRQNIWRATFAPPRQIKISEIFGNVKYAHSVKPPIAHAINQESRTETLLRYEMLRRVHFEHWLWKGPSAMANRGYIFFHPPRDSIIIESIWGLGWRHLGGARKKTLVGYYMDEVSISEHPALRDCLDKVRTLDLVYFHNKCTDPKCSNEIITNDYDTDPWTSTQKWFRSPLNLFSGLKEIRFAIWHYNEGYRPIPGLRMDIVENLVQSIRAFHAREQEKNSQFKRPDIRVHSWWSSKPRKWRKYSDVEPDQYLHSFPIKPVSEESIRKALEEQKQIDENH
ncbi:hypothetical protein B0J14DRAFT_563363 [Halenospora varia]|nr:hypothetical protein B0J14DRAFT_563363 [Halenospora varia]